MNADHTNSKGQELTQDPKVLQARVDFFAGSLVIGMVVENALWVALRALLPEDTFREFHRGMEAKAAKELKKLEANYKERTGEEVSQ